MDMSLSELLELVIDREAWRAVIMGSQRAGHDWVTELNWTGLIKVKREKNQFNKIRNEKGEVTTDNEEIQRIIKDYYEQLYGNKMDNLEVIDKHSEKYNFQKLNQEEIENLNIPITSTEI